METIAITYVPVIHKGYLNFLERCYTRDVREVWILGPSFQQEAQIHLEIRCLDAEMAAELITDLAAKTRHIDVITYAVENPESAIDLKNAAAGARFIVMNDDVCRTFVKKYLKGRKVEFDSAFLRWDDTAVFSKTDVKYDRLSRSAFDQRIMKLAAQESVLSSCWWRRVGAVAVKGSGKHFAHNRHLPTEHAPYINGDPRDVIPAGRHSHLASSAHAEQVLIATAAAQGIKLAGCSLYLTTFPCPVCAKLIALADIKKLYFGTGHANLDGQNILKAFGIEIILVKMRSGKAGLK